VIYEIQGVIITDNTGIRNAVTTILPSESDPKFRGGLGAAYEFFDGINEDGFKQIAFRYVYELKTDREALLNNLKGLSGIINACEDGSFVTPVGNKHDTNPPSGPCDIQAGGISKP
jgi:hypothetical protein